MRAFHAVTKYYNIIMINNNDKNILQSDCRRYVAATRVILEYMERICMRIDHGHRRSAVMLYSYYYYTALPLGEHFNGTYYYSCNIRRFALKKINK